MPQPAVRTRLGADKRRGQIVRAAAEVFSTRPYDDISTGELAAAAGVSRGLLHHYFSTKRELYVAVVARLMDRADLPLPDFVEGATAEDRIKESVAAWVALIERESAAWLTATALSGAAQDEQVAKLLDAAVDRGVDAIAETAGIRHGDSLDPSTRAALRGFAGFATATCNEWLQHRRLTRDQVILLLEGALIHLVRDLIPRLREES